MPDNEFESLAAELGFGAPAAETPAVGTAEEQPEVPATEAAAPEATATPNEGTGTEQAATEPAKTEETKQPQSPQQDKANHAFAELRTKVSKYEKSIQRAAQAVGMSVDDFLANLENTAVEKQAAAQGVPKEFLQRVEAAEERSRMFELETAKQRVQTNLLDLKTDLQLNETEVQRFVKDCIHRGVDLTQPNVDMKGMYRGMYFDEILEKQRQAWIIKDASNKSSASTPNGVQGRGSGKPNLVESDAQLSDILSKL